MPVPVVVINSFNTATAGRTVMNGTPENGIENRRYPQRFYRFNMVITQQFPYRDETLLSLSDNDSTDTYMLIDRLNKPITADELEPYAANRRCIACQFDAVTKTIKVFSCLSPTNRYIDEWLTPTTTTPTTPSTTTE